MNKYQIPGWDELEWNASAGWAIPLPLFPVDGALVVCRWYVPDEAPLIPTGWIYRLAGGKQRASIVCGAVNNPDNSRRSEIERAKY